MNAAVSFIVDTIYNGLEYFGKYYSNYRAYVVDNNDPAKQGRLKLFIPGIVDEPMEYWAPSIGIFSGQGYGFHFIPPVNSVVWVSFEHGNPSFPIWTYGYFGENEIPDSKSDIGNYWMATPGGHSIELDDTNKSIKITSIKGDVVTINDNGISLESNKIFLGTTDEGKEPSVMGTTLETSLKDITQQIEALTNETKSISSLFNTTIGNLVTPADLANPYTSALAANIQVQTTALNAQLQSHNLALDNINKSLSSINEGLPKIKSKKVSLDYE